MNNFKVIKNPDGTFSTAPADPDTAQADLAKARKAARDAIYGVGQPQAQKDAPKPEEGPANGIGNGWVQPHEPKGLVWVPDEAEELDEWDHEKCSCHLHPPCSYCSSGKYRI